MIPIQVKNILVSLSLNTSDGSISSIESIIEDTAS